jgi:hypothetical protein
MSTPSAQKAELAARARQISAPAAPPEQLDLLPAVDRINTMDAAAVAANGLEERRRGRPKGAENLSNRALREMIVRAGGHPVLQMARWSAMTPEELSIRLGITKAEAFDRLLQMWDRLTPLVAARLAPTDAEGNAVPNILMTIGGQASNGMGALDGGVPPWERAFRTLEGELVEVPEDIKQIQGLGGSAHEAQGEKSLDGKSHEGQ